MNMSIQMLDYYQKGLPAKVRQQDIPAAFERINRVAAEEILPVINTVQYFIIQPPITE